MERKAFLSKKSERYCIRERKSFDNELESKLYQSSVWES